MTKSNSWRQGERAHHFEVAFCDGENCGLHLIAFREDHEAICEIVMSSEQTLRLVGICKDFLYDKATKKE